MGLFDFLRSKNFDELFENELEKVMAEPEDVAIYDEIAENYVTLLGLLNVFRFTSFTFPDREDCRRVTVDGMEYDFDAVFSHDDAASHILAANDCLMADINEDVQTVLAAVEQRMKVYN